MLIIATSSGTLLAQTVAVQDIDWYAERDRERPKRDARVGMLPPKLAQIILNLATGPQTTGRLLDPFCGTGVVLQEALLLGYDAYGTDLEPRMITYSQANLDWLASRQAGLATPTLAAGDATSFAWEPPIDFVATETYLGRPFTDAPDTATLAQTIQDCNLIISKFLRNMHRQLTPGTSLCLAVPAWQIRKDEFKHLPLIDQLGQMGYNRTRFEHVRDEQLLYYREDQTVARQLLVITRN